MNQPRPVERPLRSPPVGAVLLAILAGLLYALELAILRDASSGEGVGDRLDAEFIAIFTSALWIVLAGLMLVAFKNGKMPEWAALAAVVLLPLSGHASFTAASIYATNHDWTWIVPVLAPPVIVIYALWIRIPALVAALSEEIVSAFAGATLVALIGASAFAWYLDELAAPARQEKQQAAYKEQLALDEKIAAEDRARDEARFAALGPDSPLRDYLEYVNSSDDRVPLAMEGARHARSRQADALALLGEEEGLMKLREMWQLDIAATPALCAAYNTALGSSALKIDLSYNNRLGEAIDLEFQLPNLKWLVAQHCDLQGMLTELARRLRVVRDSPRIDQLADTFDALAR